MLNIRNDGININTLDKFVWNAYIQMLQISLWMLKTSLHTRVMSHKVGETCGTEGHIRTTRVTYVYATSSFSKKLPSYVLYSNIRWGERDAWNGYTSCSLKQRDILVYQVLYNATYGVNVLIQAYTDLTSVRFLQSFRQKISVYEENIFARRWKKYIHHLITEYI